MSSAGGSLSTRSGYIYVAGDTSSLDFPAVDGFQESSGGGATDGFVAKIDPKSSQLVFATYFGGSDQEIIRSVAVDANFNIYVTGQTYSQDFPLKDPFQSFQAGDGDAFVAKFAPDGLSLIYSTYVGGSLRDSGSAIAVGADGSAFVAGATESSDFPTATAAQATPGGATDAFILKLSPDGLALTYSTYLGGSSYDAAWSVAVDKGGAALVAGNTYSRDFPVNNAYQPVFGGGVGDAFVAKLSPDGTAFQYETFLGGAGYDWAWGIALDDSGNAYVIGETSSTDFPTLNPIQATYGGGSVDVFASKLNPNGSALLFSTYFGGAEADYGRSIAVNSVGRIFFAGATNSRDFPLIGSLQSLGSTRYTHGFLACFDQAVSKVIYATLLGGTSWDWVNGLAVDGDDNAYVVGTTNSRDFPLLNPTQASLNGSVDAFFATVNARTTFNITVDDGTHSIVTPAGTSGKVTVWRGAEQTFSIVPNDCYHLVDVLVDDVSRGPVPSYTFKDVATDHTLVVVCEINQYTLNASATSLGTIRPAGTFIANCGDSRTFWIEKQTNSRLVDVLVDGVSKGKM